MIYIIELCNRVCIATNLYIFTTSQAQTKKPLKLSLQMVSMAFCCTILRGCLDLLKMNDSFVILM